jgi:hypothetical protein
VHLNPVLARAVFNGGFLLADAFDSAFCQNRLIVHVEQFIFKCGAADVGDKDFHGKSTGCPVGG